MLQALLLALAYQTKYYDQLVDHFGFGTATFRHRFLYNDTFWGTKGPLQNGCRGPILFYTGNEGPITGFYGSNGFMTDVLAPEFGALRAQGLVHVAAVVCGGNVDLELLMRHVAPRS